MQNIKKKETFVNMVFQAHKGVSTENPENTMPAFMSAIRQGYKIIELDVSVTKDQKFVLLHDSTINRTARQKSGDILPHEIKIGDITYANASEYDFGIWFSKKFKGTKIPLLKEVLDLARELGIKLKVDNKYQKFTVEQKKLLFDLLADYPDTACLTCSDVESIKEAHSILPDMHFHYDGTVTQEILEMLSKILSKDQLTVWLPLKSNATSWVKLDFADRVLSSLVKQYARLGLWILSTPEQLRTAEEYGADVVETNGQVKPLLNEGLTVDMHTHSENSHDSVCKIEDMYKKEAENGSRVFAVTDHFDTASFKDYDVFTPIEKSYKTVRALDDKYKNKILTGVEIGEAFWHPGIYEKVKTLVDYDVLIGSVHLVWNKNLNCAYSQIDFSKLSEDTILEYLDAYFDDIITMIDTVEFDILAHLTCPFRYISGKYNIDIDISFFDKKIKHILQLIIQKGIALEVNTSAYNLINDFMPSVDILKKYFDMGGYLITLGSDAHMAEDASKYFNEALVALRAIGFKNIFYYKKRNIYQITI